MMTCVRLLTGCLVTIATITAGVHAQQKPPSGRPTSWPMFGGTPARNMVNTIDTNIPTTWSVEEGNRKNVKWVAQLGSKSYGGPVVADGKIFVGTNNSKPDKKDKNHKAVLMAFNEADGKLLWELAHESPADPLFDEGRSTGMVSTPTVEGKLLYYVTPGCEVTCASTDGKVQWRYDMMKELKVVPFHLANCSPLIAGDLVMVITNNGVNEEGKIVSPKAPSFIAVHKKTGKLACQSSLPGENIIEAQLSNPTLANVNGKSQVIFAGGDCAIYAFQPESGKLIWTCNCNPFPKKKAEREINNYIVGTPVVVGDRLYVGLGPYPEHPNAQRASYFLCLDITKQGDVSLKSYDAKDPANKMSGLIWAFGGAIVPRPEKAREVHFGPTASTAAVHDGLVYISEDRGYLHCLDAKTGQRYWNHDFRSTIWGSPYWVDGKIYIGVDDGDIVIFKHGKDQKVLPRGEVEVIARVSMDEAVHSTPVVAGGVLYITTKSKLYAIAHEK